MYTYICITRLSYYRIYRCCSLRSEIHNSLKSLSSLALLNPCINNFFLQSFSGINPLPFLRLHQTIGVWFDRLEFFRSPAVHMQNHQNTMAVIILAPGSKDPEIDVHNVCFYTGKIGCHLFSSITSWFPRKMDGWKMKCFLLGQKAYFQSLCC